MFWYKDTENRHIKINRHAAYLEGLPITAIEGKTAEELYPPDEAAAYRRDDLEVINSGEPKLGIIEKHTGAGGMPMWLETGKIPYRDANGDIIGVIAFAIDVTQQRQTQRFLSDTLDTVIKMVERNAGRDELKEYLEKAQQELDALA